LHIQARNTRPQLRVLQRWGLIKPASQFSICDRRPHRSHLYKNVKEGQPPVQDVLQSFGANLIQLTDRSPGADIAPLAKAGVPTLGIMQDARTYFNYHHTAADTLDKIVPQELRENAAAMAVMEYALADLPEPLPS
jgi:Zn-dependent M28 family amino/carboxypeptidase